jgi:hypothetical protein
MDKPIYAREHDLLKLCDNFQKSKDEKGRAIGIHYCPVELKRIDETLYKQLLESPLWPSLRHHCNTPFRPVHFKHACYDYHNRNYAVTAEDLFLTLADTTASTISRKLRREVIKKNKYFYRTIRIWKEDRDDQTAPKPQYDEIVYALCSGKTSPKVLYDQYRNEMKDRAEDSARFPFSSLDLHNRLVAHWYQFFIKSKRYFDTAPIEQFVSSRQARWWIGGISSKKRLESDGRIRKPIVFCRCKIKVNENLARINDVTLIADVPKLIENLCKKVPGQ